ncbi:hypothetical protein ACWKSP_26620 [Micromonosporaceae bacterium Da 78-11]
MERIDLTGLEHTVDRVWATGEPGHWQYACVQIGRLATGQWFAARHGLRWSNAWAATDERQACEAVEAWTHRRSRGMWREQKPAGG